MQDTAAELVTTKEPAAAPILEEAPDDEDISMLLADPSLAAQFDSMYGDGKATNYLCPQAEEQSQTDTPTDFWSLVAAGAKAYKGGEYGIALERYELALAAMKVPPCIHLPSRVVSVCHVSVDDLAGLGGLVQDTLGADEAKVQQNLASTLHKLGRSVIYTHAHTMSFAFLDISIR